MKIDHQTALLALSLLGFLGATSSDAADVSPRATATATTTIPGAAAAAKQPVLSIAKPDLVADGIGTTNLLFRVRNIGRANSPATITKVECFTNAAAALGDPCQPNVHYVTLPGVVLPPGTSMSSPNTWRVPVGGLDAVTGFTTFGLNIRSASGVNNGLKFRVCAEAAEVVAESNETNNCSVFVYNWPN
jgi:hypothetical protein